MKKTKINPKRLIIVVVVAVVAIFLGIKLASMFANDPYAAYNTYNEETKKYGDIEHDKKENVELNSYLSVYYPEFEEEELNKIVESYKKEYVKENQKFDQMTFMMVDYDVDKIYDQYITLTFHQTWKNEQDKVLKDESVSYNYDLKNKKQLTYRDVIRRDYIAKLKSLAKANKIDEKKITTKNLNNFIIGPKDVTFYFDNDPKQQVKINYEKDTAYVALINKNIPSLYKGEQITPKPQPKVEEGKQVIAFTFDDGPRDPNTLEIMKELEKYNGRGTFFMLGQNVEEYPNTVKEMYKRGHELANHSWDHSEGIAAKGYMSADEVSHEVYDTNDAIFKLTGFEPRYMRPPYGAINDTLENVCGLDFINWDIDTLDWQSHDPVSIANIIEKHADIGYRVILLHDIHDESVEGAKRALKILHDKGYQFVTISTLLEQEKAYYVDKPNTVYFPTVVGK